MRCAGRCGSRGAYLRQAAAKAVARSANREAIALFEQALAALQQRPEDPETLGEALDIRIALGPCLGIIHGHGAPEKEASYVAARELCLRLDDRPRLFPALWGLWHVSFNRGLHREARDLGEELISLARELGDPVFLLEAHHSLWTTLYGSGEPRGRGAPSPRGPLTVRSAAAPCRCVGLRRARHRRLLPEFCGRHRLDAWISRPSAPV